MLATPSADLSSTALGFKAFLESSYDNRNVVHVTAGSFIPLLKNSVWFVVRGMVKLGALSMHGDELVLGLVGPNEPFGAAFTNVEAYEAVALTDCDLLLQSRGARAVSSVSAWFGQGHGRPLPPGGVAPGPAGAASR